MVLLVYVDDIIITGQSSQGIQLLKQRLHQEFKLKDLGSLGYFLGLEVAKSQHGIFFTKELYSKATWRCGSFNSQTPTHSHGS